MEIMQTTATLRDIQLQRLRQFLRWTCVASALGTVFQLGMWLWEPIWPDAVVGLSIFGFTVLTGVLYGWLPQLGIERTVLALAIGLLLLPLIMVLMRPKALGILVMVPFMTAVISVPYLSGRLVRLVLWMCWVTIVITAVLSYFVDLFQLDDPLLRKLTLITDIAMLAGLILVLIWRLFIQLMANVEQLETANTQLKQASTTLEQQVAARTRDLEKSLAENKRALDEQQRLLQENATQRSLIQGLSVPLLPVGRATLVLPLIGELDAERLAMAQAHALDGVSAHGARRLIIDVTGVSLIDSHVALALTQIIVATRLLGAETMLVGIRPEVAQAMIALGLDLANVPTAQTLEAGLAIF